MFFVVVTTVVIKNRVKFCNYYGDKYGFPWWFPFSLSGVLTYTTF